MRLRPATMSRQQQTGVLETIEPPSAPSTDRN
jgi:hypothetical protein